MDYNYNGVSTTFSKHLWTMWVTVLMQMECTRLTQRSRLIDVTAPENVRELCSFLGLVNYYGKFVPNLVSLLHPLHQLLQTGTR